jgi:hypothetical protein
MKSFALCAAALVLVAACAPKSDVTKAAAVSNAITAKPSDADSILKANDYTPESFQTAMYEIAKDSAKSAQYAAAVKQ